jgi:5-methylcytosine-specific restriction endonuclease McrA
MSAALRKLVRHRAGARCEYCRLPELVSHLQPFHLEHVRPRCHGGTTSLPNLAWACSRCNALKGPNLSGVDPDSDRVLRLFNPRRDRWDEHFVMNRARIEPLTARGRTTAWLLEFNDPDRLFIREGLLDLGLL